MNQKMVSLNFISIFISLISIAMRQLCHQFNMWPVIHKWSLMDQLMISLMFGLLLLLPFLVDFTGSIKFASPLYWMSYQLLKAKQTSNFHNFKRDWVKLSNWKRCMRFTGTSLFIVCQVNSGTNIWYFKVDF